jgi:hydroxyacylglutathione hydrolase
MKKWITQNGLEVYQLLGGRCNCFLIAADRNFMLVDTGGKIWRRTLINRIEVFRRPGQYPGGLAPTGIILTHTHFDHTENAAALKKEYDLPIFVHRHEAGYLSRGENPPITGTFPPVKWVTNVFGSALEKWKRYETVRPDILVEETYDLGPWGLPGYLLSTPGHTPGSLSVVIDNEIAIVGDAMVGMFRNSVYSPFACDPDEMIRSWGKLLDTGCSLFLPAHGAANPRELLEKQYKRFNR